MTLVRRAGLVRWHILAGSHARPVARTVCGQEIADPVTYSGPNYRERDLCSKCRTA